MRERQWAKAGGEKEKSEKGVEACRRCGLKERDRYLQHADSDVFSFVLFYFIFF